MGRCLRRAWIGSHVLRTVCLAAEPTQTSSSPWHTNVYAAVACATYQTSSRRSPSGVLSTGTVLTTALSPTHTNFISATNAACRGHGCSPESCCRLRSKDRSLGLRPTSSFAPSRLFTMPFSATALRDVMSSVTPTTTGGVERAQRRYQRARCRIARSSTLSNEREITTSCSGQWYPMLHQQLERDRGHQHSYAQHQHLPIWLQRQCRHIYAPLLSRSLEAARCLQNFCAFLSIMIRRGFNALHLQPDFVLFDTTFANSIVGVERNDTPRVNCSGGGRKLSRPICSHSSTTAPHVRLPQRTNAPCLDIAARKCRFFSTPTLLASGCVPADAGPTFTAHLIKTAKRCSPSLGPRQSMRRFFRVSSSCVSSSCCSGCTRIA
ncbi:hypothetical protein IWX90DRAFT_62816 [Phyllosticta citrichinensis]|uniref:Secreted protein n=1 Tax=Phyllosticta citrichinensis TaxID=1130410 RepID=A0ABR1XH71_9PEZI